MIKNEFPKESLKYIGKKERKLRNIFNWKPVEKQKELLVKAGYPFFAERPYLCSLEVIESCLRISGDIK